MRIRISGPLILLLVLALPASLLAHGGFTPNPQPPAGPPAPPRTDLLNEGFEDAWPPAGWVVLNEGNTYTWNRTGNNQHTGAYSAYVHYGSQSTFQDEYLVTEALDFTGMNAVFLEFYEDQDYWPGFGDHHYIGVSTTSQTDPAAFTMIVDWTPATHTIAGFAGDPVTVNLSDYAGEPVVYLCFRYTGTYADDWYVDDITVYEPFEHDVALEDLLPDGEQFAAPGPLSPRVAVNNHGQNPEIFDVSLDIRESGTLVYSEIMACTLAVAEHDTLDFPDLALAAGNYYLLDAAALLAGDMDTSNDAAGAFNDTYTRSHVPLGHFHTNASCGYCAPADNALDAYMASQGDAVALLRVHTWWPNPADIVYQANPAQSQQLILSYAADYTPHLWIDGTTDAGSGYSGYGTAFEARKLTHAPGELAMHWNPFTEQLLARLDLQEPLDPAGDYRLRVVLTEDGVYYAGGNGHNIHDNCFRYMYPTTDGLALSPDVGTQTFVVDCPLDGGWVFEELRALAYLQDEATWRIWQASADHLADLQGGLAIEPSVSSVEQYTDFALAVTIDPAHLGVKGVDAEIAFDPAVVALDSVTPGDWFAGSGLDYFFYDYTLDPPDPAASIRFSAAFLDGQRTEAGEVAVCHFRALMPGATDLSFTAAQVRDSLNTELGFLTSCCDSINVTPATAADPAAPPAPALRLAAAPNPFNPSTRIVCSMPAAGRWRLELFACTGRRVRVLLDGWQEAGTREVVWDGRDGAGRALGSGVYLARLSGPGGSRGLKLVLLK